MSERLNGAYWKLWHDVRSRFAISLVMIALVLGGVFAPPLTSARRPMACITVTSNLSWPQMREIIRDAKTHKEELTRQWTVQRNKWVSPAKTWGSAMMPYGLPNALQIRDGDVLYAHCGASERPNLAYAAEVENYVSSTSESVWNSMVYMFLFIGILLSVGPPFSGESMEAFSLTFSLPWSREKWLLHRIAMSVVLLVILAIIAVLALKIGTHFPFMSQMKGGYPKSAIAQRRIGEASAWWVLLAGLVGISLGTVASLFSRNVLTAATFACLAAYLLVSVRFSPNTLGIGGDILPIIVNGTVLTAFLVIGIASLLVSTRLRTTDF